MDPLVRKVRIGLLKLNITIAGVLFISAGTLRFWQAWVFWIVAGGSLSFITLYFLRHDRRLIENRLRGGPKAESRPIQKVILALASVLMIPLLALPGFDHRFGWSRLPAAICVLGDVLVTVGSWILFLVFQENTTAFATVRVEAGQQVISTGPYSVVRHPMYACAMFQLIGMPLALGSLWALPVGVALGGAIVVRLVDEEKFLAGSLPGYGAYREKVRYRLIPGIW